MITLQLEDKSEVCKIENDTFYGLLQQNGINVYNGVEIAKRFNTEGTFSINIEVQPKVVKRYMISGVSFNYDIPGEETITVKEV